MTNAQDLPEPTACYADGCDRENELLLHVAMIRGSVATSAWTTLGRSSRLLR